MKKEKKMMVTFHRVSAIVKKGDKLSRKLLIKIIEECSGKDSDLVALSALAKTVIDVVESQVKSGHTDAMTNFLNMLEAEVRAKIMMEKARYKVSK